MPIIGCAARAPPSLVERNAASSRLLGLLALDPDEESVEEVVGPEAPGHPHVAEVRRTGDSCRPASRDG